MAFDSEELLSRAERAQGDGATSSAASVSVLTFHWGDELYGLPLGDVREVAKLGAVTRVPGLPAVLLGAMNLRGEILALADVRSFLGFPAGTVSAVSRLVVVSHGSERVGLLVDGIGDIVDVEVAPASSSAELVTGQTVLASGALLHHLDLPRVLAQLMEKG